MCDFQKIAFSVAMSVLFFILPCKKGKLVNPGFNFSNIIGRFVL